MGEETDTKVQMGCIMAYIYIIYIIVGLVGGATAVGLVGRATGIIGLVGTACNTLCCGWG
jgi:hypothetical protein